MKSTFRKLLIPVLLSTFASSIAMAQHGGMGDSSHQKDGATYRYLLLTVS